ncbi:hypothetical protein ASE74_10075 [Pedobacter sp. Leaf216]|uniref:LytR/AlgR family response regulator transcription factor n=1 Tax=Pedobacter sp. Leaf216 TaxID=1735684 RepID=UPI0006F3C849|nr:LytTR family DNA-binding domain-containing protein [Pedobacter sp. Leaf216]KQM65208.1 hypothetical protein ASE74_10075 [Pedobacter sp. Leaf216]
MSIRCIVVDDDVAAIEDITEYIHRMPELKLLRTFHDAIDALQYVKDEGGIDLMFVDVDMPVINGVELSSLVKTHVHYIIFTTSHSKYALDAFEVNATGFLLKPFNFARFFRELQKILVKSEITALEPKQDYVYIKSRDENTKLVKVRFADIVALESQLNYITVHTEKRKFTTHLSLKEAIEILARPDLFVQVHRSFVVSKEHIESMEGNTLSMTGGSKFTISESYRQHLHDIVNSRVLRPRIKL